ncbi:UNVERIFIED_CONTAM: hypothetical protein FKN15_074110 [Acipenser sinensis]
MGSGGRLYCAFISACLVVLGMLLMLQVFVRFRAPGPRWVTKDGLTFTIISIDNSRDGGQPGGGARGNQLERSGSPRGLETRGAVFLESEAGVLWDYIPQFYQDENENFTQKQSDRSQIDLQPWAGGQPSFTAEVQRFIEYISTTQQSDRSQIDLQPWAGGQPSFTAEVQRFIEYISTTQQSDRSQIDLQPWAGGQPSFTAEVQRFIEYISTTQVHCARELMAGEPQEEKVLAGSWTVCLEGWFLNREVGPCVAYSFSLDQKDAGFVSRMASLAGCEVHQFDPGARPVPGRDERGVKRHQTWLDWREPKHGNRRNTPKKLGLIMESLGHHKQSDRSQIDLQPWAGGQPSFTAEVQRFIEYISTTQVHCARELMAGEPQEEKVLAGSWTVCLEGWFLNREVGPCVAYSFSLDQKDAGFVSRMASLAGCEVHQFDPGARPVPGRDERGVKRHQTWLDWREPKHGNRRNTPKKLGLIMESLGHHKVEFVQADQESAEWKVLENLVLDGTLGRIQQLVVTVHLHWAGFEVGGSEAGVVRFWYSLLKELQGAGYRLLHSARGPGHTILQHRLAGVSSTYTLSWVNTRWNY